MLIEVWQGVFLGFKNWLPAELIQLCLPLGDYAVNSSQWSLIGRCEPYLDQISLDVSLVSTVRIGNNMPIGFNGTI